MLSIALALQAVTWNVKDTTDNNTGAREISALQMSENDVAYERYAALSIDCDNRKVRMQLIWPVKLGSGFVPVKVDWGIGPWHRSLGRPAAWAISPYSDNQIAEAPGDDARRIVEAIPKRASFQLTIYQAEGEKTAYFLSEGMKAAYDRVAANCPTPLK